MPTTLTIASTSDVAAGLAAFGPSSPLMTWSDLFPSTAASATDPLTGAVVTATTGAGSSLNIGNWIDGPGFNLSGAGAGPDLALNGAEEFTLSFTHGVTTIGLAVSTGLGNYPHQTDQTGAVFQLTTNNGDTGTLTLDPGSGVTWLTVQSATPFTSITFFEPSGNVEDQYFGSVIGAASTVVSSVTFTTAATQSVAENTTLVAALTATDADTVGTSPALFSITGGADQALFDISGGNLVFKVAPDYETQPHSYQVEVSASDGTNSTAKTISVTLTDQNDNAPVITTAATQSVAENTTLVAALTATDADTVGTSPALFSITGGADQALFDISGGNLVFKVAPDYETQPHSYQVEVSASDGTNSTAKTISVEVTDAKGVTRIGNAAANVLIGTEELDQLFGLGGNDVLLGLGGADLLVGGLGNDTYFLDDPGDTITELSGEGTDTVRSSITYSLGPNVENMFLMGSANINGTGNELNNSIAGNSGNNTLDGAAGRDTLIGGEGNDTYIVRDAKDVVIELAGQGMDKIQSYVSYKLGSNVENLDLNGNNAINGTGNTLANLITGNSGNNILNGGLGADTLMGGAGNDTYLVDDTNDIVTEASGEGIDSVQAMVSFSLADNVENLTLKGTANTHGTGNALVNVITGNAGANIIDGGGGADTLNGGAGHDTVSYTSSSAGVIVMLKGATPSPAFGGDAQGDIIRNFENATGSSFPDILIGSSAANVLDGGAGADQMAGGPGNDTYIVDNPGDVVIEAAGGSDTVKSAIDYTLVPFVENLTLTGTADINGTGNALANIITGNSGDNFLDGGLDLNASIVDLLRGREGNDTYIVRDAKDAVIELAGQGMDKVQSYLTYKLGSNVENLDLIGSSAINGSGNMLANQITGNSAANTLNGGRGSDTLTGGMGADKFLFNTALNGATNVDHITDFELGVDHIQLENAIFTRLAATGTLKTEFFHSGTVAADANDYIIYNDATGALYYDSNGSGAGQQVQFATLDPGLALTNTSFTVV